MWIYDGDVIDVDILDEFVGFVYIITNLKDGRRYIGKKLLKFKRTKKVKGKKKRFLIDSDWREYWGSNKTLQSDVAELGETSFTREIIRLCRSRGELNYFEAKYQFQHGVLESDQWYNEWISAKIHKAHLKKVDFVSIT